MDQFFIWLSNNQIASIVFTIALVIVACAILVFLIILVFAFIQGREITIFNFSIGKKPDKPSENTKIALKKPIVEPENQLRVSTPISKVKELITKIDYLKNNENLSFNLIGSVYVDVILRPIDTVILERNEWSNIDPLKFELGGSTLYVGKYLWEISNHSQKSHVFSLMGGSADFITHTFTDLVNNEKWLINDIIRGRQNSQTAVTVHLVQRDNKFTTMFTHQGILGKLDWTYFGENLETNLSSGGVVYISGYFKTNLCADLEFYLRKIQKNSLVCIEHGQLVRKLVNPHAMQSLRESFNNYLVDVYICTFKEFLDFYEYDHDYNYLVSENTIMEILEHISSFNKLPIITVIRDSYLPTTKLYIIIGQKIIPVEGKRGELLSKSGGPKNAFNASFMYRLATGPSLDSFEESILDAARYALDKWHLYGS